MLAEMEKKSYRQSLNYLTNSSPFIRGFRSLQHFILHASETDQKQAAAIEYHLKVLSDGLARTLWRKEIFLGLKTIRELFYSSLLIETGQPIRAFLEAVLESEMSKPGFVIYPLHSFGLINVDVDSCFEGDNKILDLSTEGVVISTQSNDSQKTNMLLERICASFSIDHKMPNDLLEHFRKTRNLHWLDYNPLLAVKVASFSGLYHENQVLFILKIRLATALVMMMATMGKAVNKEEAILSRTSIVNNAQTLDLHHYLVFQVQPEKDQALEIKCVPMNIDQRELLELSDLGVELDLGFWRDLTNRPLLDKLYKAMRTLETGYLKHFITAQNKHSVVSLVHQKLLVSINHFRRSFRDRGQDSENIVALAIALETLLTDSFASGVTKRIIDRVEICLYSDPDMSVYINAVNELFSCRGNIVHHGKVAIPDSYLKARQAYVLCFLAMVHRLSKLPKESDTPIADLLNANH